MNWKGETGIAGPAGITDFEIRQGEYWNEKHAQLQNLCFQISRFILENPGIASKVIVTKDTIKSLI